jgi:hypothetical protein
MVCKQCGEEFVETKSWQSFCQPRCRDRWHYDKRRRVMAAQQPLDERPIDEGIERLTG